MSIPIRAALLCLLAVALLGSSTAEAKPTIYPVQITVKVKNVAELPPDSPWYGVEGVDQYPVIVLYGRVTSPKPACKRRRPIVAFFKSPYETAEEGGVTSDAAGKFEGEPVPDFSFTEEIRSGKAHLWVKVARKRLGKGRFCAKAKSQPLKA